MRVGNYEILGEAGRGGRGVVLKARSPDGALLAIKIPTGSSDGDALARFRRERRLLEAFGESEGFVPLVGSGEQQGVPYLVMPFLAGGTLRSRLARERFSLAGALELGLGLARAMAIAHERGIVHRDLKPENVLFAASGKPLIADLGLAKHWKDTTPGASQTVVLSHAGEVRGTIGYMPPEQLRDAMSAGPPADVFALGAIMHECLTGEPAFRGTTAVEVFGRIANGNFERARTRGEAPWLDAVLDRALDPLPDRRYADAAALARALEAGPAAYSARTRRRRALALGVALAAVVLSLAAVLLLRTRISPLDEARSRLQEAQAAALPRARLELALAAAELAHGDDAETKAVRGEALELAARLELEAGDARAALAAAREALALAPAQDARQLLLAEAALRAGEPDQAFSALEKTLAGPAPPLDVFRAGALARLGQRRFAEAEELARRGLSVHGDDPSLLVARGRALRGLGRSTEALGPLAAAERAGDPEAHAERSVATIEACPISRCDDPQDVMISLDRDTTSSLERQADTLLATVEKEWPAARSHPAGRDTGLAAIASACNVLCKTRSVSPASVESWTRILLHARSVYRTVAAGAASEVSDAAAMLAVLGCYADDLEPAERIFPQVGKLPLRVRFGLRATLGISRFVPIVYSSAGECHFDGDESLGIEELDAALAEDPLALDRAGEEDRFVRELRRTALRVRAWALWHRAARDPSRAADLARAERSGREAYEIPPAFPAYKDGPILEALVPALLLESKLDDAEELVVRFEAFQAEWNGLNESSHELDRQIYTSKWAEVEELRGDLELRRHHPREAAAAFERAARDLNTRSSWLGLARALDELGDASRARAARIAAHHAGEPYLVWLDR